MTEDDTAVKLGVADGAFPGGGMDELSGFPYHGFNSDTGMKYGIIGWGRAVGWLTSGMSESLAYLPEKHRSSVLSGNISKDLRKRRLNTRGKTVALPGSCRRCRTGGYFSATAMIACALLRGMQFGNLDADFRTIYSGQESICFPG